MRFLDTPHPNLALDLAFDLAPDLALNLTLYPALPLTLPLTRTLTLPLSPALPLTRLFRKVGDQSSQFFPDVHSTRIGDGNSYIF